MDVSKAFGALRRPLALMLAAVTVVTGVQLLGLPRSSVTSNAAAADFSGPTGNVLERTADPITMMEYLDAFGQNDDSGSRYMGRVWTDKSVLAYDEPQNVSGAVFENNTLTVNGKSVTLNDDFLNVFSATASSEKVNTYPPAPIDLVILLDMSGSMGADVEPGCPGTHPEGEKETRIQHSRIYKTITAINETIDELMEMNDYNRVAVVGYGATSAVMMPLAHYQKKDGQPYLSVSGFVVYGNNTWEHAYKPSGSCAYEITVVGQKTDTFGDDAVYSDLPDVSYVNDYTSKKYYSGFQDGNEKFIGFHTDLQAGIYTAFNLLYDGVTEDTAKFSYTFGHNGRTVNVPRVPSVFVMTDGGSNYALKSVGGDVTGDEWHAVPVDVGECTDMAGPFTKYDCEDDYPKTGGAAVILDILMTASYMKTKVESKYTKLLQEGGVYDYSESMDMFVYSISVDPPTNTAWQVPRIYAAMDPAEYFNDQLKPVGNVDPSTWAQEKDILDAYSAFTEWQNADESGIDIAIFSSRYEGSSYSGDEDVHVKFKKLPDDGEDLGNGIKITNEQVAENIRYNDAFLDIESADLSASFDKMLETVKGRAFEPVGGANDFGAVNSITYADPIGLYLEVKDGALTGTADAPKSEHKDVEYTYDMMLSLFGEMHGVVKTAVYDYNFEHSSNWKNAGWYGADGSFKDKSGSFEDGDMYYLDSGTALEFLPTLDTIGMKAQNTVYTFYRLAETDRTAVLKNPAYTDTDDITYALSDIRIWVEDTGNFNDDAYGSVMPESGYEQLLCFSVPAGAIPAYLTEVTEGPERVTIYDTNEENKTAWEPIRLYYATGVRDEAMTDDNLDVDVAKLHQEYVSAHRTEDGAGIYFRDTHWSESKYDAYQVYRQEVPMGDAVVSFSPSDDNRYYRFQKPLPLYTKVYQYKVSSSEPRQKLEPVDFQRADWDGVEIKGVFATAEKAMAGCSDGDYVVLETDRITQRDDGKYDKEWLIIVGDYYRPSSGHDGGGEYVSRAVTRLGSEFETDTGSPLCWFNPITNKTKPFDTWESGAADPGWYIATAAAGFRMGDMAQMVSVKSQNKTETSSTYYLPTVNGTTLDVYLGNNGRIKIENTKLAVTKLVYGKDGKLDLEDQTDFSYDISIEGHEGSFSALELGYHDPDGEEGPKDGHWDFLVDQVAVFTTSDGFLLDGDGVSKAVVDGHTFKVKPGLSEGQGWYQDELKLVVAGYDNRDAGDTGADGAHFFPTEDQVDVYDESGENPVDEDVSMPVVWATVVGSTASGNEAGYGNTNKYAEDFKSEATWKTRTIMFSDDGKATFKLQSGDGLLFANIKSGSDYTVSESIVRDQLAAGYDLDNVQHHQQESRVTYDKSGTATEGDGNTFGKQVDAAKNTYTVTGDTGAQIECVHWTNRIMEIPEELPHKTEKTPGDGETVQIGDEIVYDISYQNNQLYPAKITITDKLDEGLDFVSADNGGTYDAASRTVTWVLNDVPAETEDGHVTLTVKVNETAATRHIVDNTASVQVNDKPAVQTETMHNPEGEPHKAETTPGNLKPVKTGDHITYEISYINNTMETAKIVIRDPLDEGNTFVSASDGGVYDPDAHTVTWTFDSVAPQTGGKVTLETEVNEKAEKTHIVYNTAYVAVGNNPEQQTETVENPEGEPHKSEVTPGNGVTVGIGDEIVYEIRYINNTEEAADVVVRDKLDRGLDFVGADHGGVYDSVTHTVTWTLKDIPSLQTGSVQLTVRVNEKAERNHAVENTASVKVGNNPEQQTETMHNPAGGPHKAETTPGAGETVQPGDEITYEITYVNNTDEAADITIRDPLDPGVTFVSASGNVFYDEPSHTVTWTVADVAALKSGKVTLTVRVNDSVSDRDGVENTAYVKVGNNPEQQTETIHNPSGGPHKTEVTPGDGQTVKIGDVIVYHISWINNTDEMADIIIRDPLDPGATFVSADNGGVYDEYGHTVRWTVTGTEPGTHGVVELQVRVNDKAAERHRVDNTAYVAVGNNPEQQTETVSNPEGEPEAHKTELTPGEGERVDVGDEIVYEITYNNPMPDPMDVVIEDPLDPNVDFVSCTEGGVYDKASHTVTWTFREVPAVSDGHSVRLTVRVNSGAVEKVYNQARVKFGNRPWADTERPENPLSAYGSLSIEKHVAGSNGEEGRLWNFTVTLGDALTGRYGDLTFMNGVTHFYLKSGEKAEITGLPAGTTYRVTEDDANVDGYYSSWTGEAGAIPESGTAKAVFTNRRDTPVIGTGGLVVRKTVTGSGDTSREWEFTVTLDSDLTGTFGDMVFRDGVATFTLMHGQRARAYGLPEGTAYQVTEAEANSGGYTTEKTGDTGEIRVGYTSVAEFVNDRPEEAPREAKLTVTKTVTGVGDKDRYWHFTVTVEGISGSFGGYTFTDGVCELTLKSGEKAVITGLPYGAKYSVKESEANQGGYRTSSSGSSGKLGDDTRCEYTNHLEPAAPGTGDGGGGLPWLLLLLGCLGGLGGLFLIPVAPDKKQRRRTRHVSRK